MCVLRISGMRKVNECVYDRNGARDGKVRDLCECVVSQVCVRQSEWSVRENGMVVTEMLKLTLPTAR